MSSDIDETGHPRYPKLAIDCLRAGVHVWIEKPPAEDRRDAKKMAGFLDHIVHPHSVLRLLGGPIEWLFVNRNSAAGSAIVSIRFTSGAAGSLHLSSGQAPTSFLERLEIIGGGENLVVENNIRLIHYRRSRNNGRPPLRPAALYATRTCNFCNRRRGTMPSSAGT